MSDIETTPSPRQALINRIKAVLADQTLKIGEKSPGTVLNEYLVRITEASGNPKGLIEYINDADDAALEKLCDKVEACKGDVTKFKAVFTTEKVDDTNDDTNDDSDTKTETKPNKEKEAEAAKKQPAKVATTKASATGNSTIEDIIISLIKQHAPQSAGGGGGKLSEDYPEAAKLLISLRKRVDALEISMNTTTEDL